MRRVEGGGSGAVGEGAGAAVLGGRGHDRSAAALGRRCSSGRLRATAWCELDARVASRSRKEEEAASGGSVALGKEGRDDGGQVEDPPYPRYSFNLEVVSIDLQLVGLLHMIRGCITLPFFFSSTCSDLNLIRSIDAVVVLGK